MNAINIEHWSGVGVWGWRNSNIFFTFPVCTLKLPVKQDKRSSQLRVHGIWEYSKNELEGYTCRVVREHDEIATTKRCRWLDTKVIVLTDAKTYIFLLLDSASVHYEDPPSVQFGVPDILDVAINLFNGCDATPGRCYLFSRTYTRPAGGLGLLHGFWLLRSFPVPEHVTEILIEILL